MDRDTVLQVGISSARDRNKQYMELTSDLQVAEVSNTDIIMEIQRGFFDFSHNRILSTSSKYRYAKIIKKFDKSIKDFVIEIFQKGWSYNKLKNVLSIDKICLLSIKSEDKLYILQKLRSDQWKC